MSDVNPKKKIGGLIVVYTVAILMGIHFIVKGVHFCQIDDIRSMGIFLLLCGLVLIVLSIMMAIKGFRNNAKKD